MNYLERIVHPPRCRAVSVSAWLLIVFAANLEANKRTDRRERPEVTCRVVVHGRLFHCVGL